MTLSSQKCLPVVVREQFTATPGSYSVNLDDLGSAGADAIGDQGGDQQAPTTMTAARARPLAAVYSATAASLPPLSLRQGCTSDGHQA